MSLKDSDIKDSYFLNGEAPYFFYNELYLHATEITIALGYFSRTAFCIGTDALLHFIKNNNGKLHLLCNDKLLLEDTEAITHGYELKQKHDITLTDFENLITSKDGNKQQKFSYDCLSYLIALGRLDISVCKSDNLVHFKAGYAIDEEGNIVAFSGSVNYTLSALLFNWEQLITFCSWKEPIEFQSKRIDDIVKPIKSLQAGGISGLPLVTGTEIEKLIRDNYKVENVLELEKEASLLQGILKINLHKKQVTLVGENDFPSFFKIPSTYMPRPHQVKAIENFFNNNFQTLFAMATGTGKTLTSLFAVNDLSFEKEITALLILVPLQDLITQWAKDVSKFFSGKIVLIGSGFNSWKRDLEDYRIAKLFNRKTPIVIISTYDSFVIRKNEILKSLEKDTTALIADEVHTFGSTNKKTMMPTEILYRIGLSATPKRAFDDDGTKAIFDFFCPSDKPFIYSIGDAIKAGYLCKYYYYPIVVELTMEEDEIYSEYSAAIRRLSSKSDSLSEEEKKQLTLLLKKRHRIIENAENKEKALEDCILSIIRKGKLDWTIIFCPEGQNENDDSYIDQIFSSLISLARKNNISPIIQKYIGGSDSKILEAFSRGLINIILAKKRLNEGIDIPSVKRAIFVSSSTSEREFIQRRGRVLRNAPGKKYAEIYDFIVVPAFTESAGKANFFNNEMKRFYDFVETAENSAEALIQINKYARV